MIQYQIAIHSIIAAILMAYCLYNPYAFYIISRERNPEYNLLKFYTVIEYYIVVSVAYYYLEPLNLITFIVADTIILISLARLKKLIIFKRIFTMVIIIRTIYTIALLLWNTI